MKRSATKHKFLSLILISLKTSITHFSFFHVFSICLIRSTLIYSFFLLICFLILLFSPKNNPYDNFKWIKISNHQAISSILLLHSLSLSFFFSSPCFDLASDDFPFNLLVSMVYPSLHSILLFLLAVSLL